MTASYPVSLATFLTYVDQDGTSHIFTEPWGTQIDLTIDAALITQQIQEEIVSIEKTIGPQPFQIPEMRTTPGGIRQPPAVGLFGYLSNSIHWLVHNKSSGRADPNNYNNVPPAPPPTHNHFHGSSQALTHDDHLQYVPVNGTRAFTGPVPGRNAVHGGDLITLSQAQGAGLTATQVQSVIQSELTEVLSDAAARPMTGPDPRRWRLTGGYFYGPTDVNGNIYIDFSRAHFAGLANFLFMKMPFPGESMLGWYNYQYMEDQLILLSLTAQGAWIQFLEDIVVDRQATVAMTWMALGI